MGKMVVLGGLVMEARAPLDTGKTTNPVAAFSNLILTLTTASP